MTPDCSARGMMMPRMWEIVCNAPRSDSMGEEKRRGHIARLRSVGCRAGAAPELRRGRFDGRGKSGWACCPASFCRMPRRRGTGTTPRQI